MLSFACDYLEGAHEKILQRLIETNYEKVPGYSADKYCESANERIKQACECPAAEVYFLVGGTQTNAIVIDTMLQRYEGVIAATTGHVNVHEAGAIEHAGHKVLTVPSYQGKMKAADVRSLLQGFWQDGSHEHMVYPGMVYLSHPTEYGTLYSKQELTDIAEVCHEYQIPLYLDGARLGYGLMSKSTDLTLADIARICDVFYIGGTKVGALCGEAAVFTKQNMPKHFNTLVKQHGAMLAKGRLLGIQFDTLFTDNLYFEIAAHAIRMAEKLKAGFKERGYSFHLDSPTNQQFIILSNEQIEKLSGKVTFEFWEPVDETHQVVRFATSWATREEDVDALMALLDELVN
ncbi:MAG: low specificity L-threonine aldolase [Lachnospiraceae bacterium]|nr:low specificity L-threonine aldolase [Lachnospiraceae bacterium]